MPRNAAKRRVCFVTGTRAEFGLMRRTLEAIQSHPKLALQILVTGMHLDRTRGFSASAIAQDGWRIHGTVPWRGRDLAAATGLAIAGISGQLRRIDSDIVLVVGDRVEALAAATAGHLSGRVVAHVHGGDRALGQVDDSLRHAITKMAHIHFVATESSRDRVLRLGEDGWRVHRVGSPGIDGIAADAGQPDLPVTYRRFALLVLHPVDADAAREYRHARAVLRAVASISFQQVVIVYPNNDPGSAGIIRCWKRHATGCRFIIRPDLSRQRFLGLLRDAAVLVGNSSSGIIEAASFGTPVIDIGPRQHGRERGENVTNVPYEPVRIAQALNQIWRDGRPKRFPKHNIYARNGTGRRIAEVLSTLRLDARMLRKLIAY